MVLREEIKKNGWVFFFVGGVEEAPHYLLTVEARARWKTGLLPRVESQFPQLSRVQADGGG